MRLSPIICCSDHLEWMYSDHSGQCTVLCGPIKLWGFGAHICMRTGQSGSRGGDFYPYKPAPRPVSVLFLPEKVSLLWFLAKLKPQSCLAGGADERMQPIGRPQSRAVSSQPRCFHSCAVSHWGFFALSEVFFTSLHTGGSRGDELAAVDCHGVSAR